MIWATRYVEKTNYPTFLSSVCSGVFYTKWEKELSFFYMTNLVQFRPRFLHSSLRSGGLGPTSGLVPWSAAKREEKTAMVNCTSKWIVAAWVTDYHPSIANIFMWNLEEDVFISASSPPPPPLANPFYDHYMNNCCTKICKSKPDVLLGYLNTYHKNMVFTVKENPNVMGCLAYDGQLSWRQRFGITVFAKLTSVNWRLQ